MQGMLDCGALAPFALPAEQGATHAGTHLQRGWARVGRRVRRRGSRRAGARRRGAPRGAARRREQRLRLERDGQVALQRAAGHRALPQGDGLLPRRSGAAAYQCGGRQGAAGARGGSNGRAGRPEARSARAAAAAAGRWPIAASRATGGSRARRWAAATAARRQGAATGPARAARRSARPTCSFFSACSTRPLRTSAWQHAGSSPSASS